ncbi:MAG: alpha-2-macroglobulin family protein, partial [Bilophila wadsworthia]
DRFPEWRKDVASTLLAGSCAIMRMNDDARHLIALYQAPGPDFQARGYLDALGVQALRASVLARHFPDMLDTQRTELAQELLDVLNGGRYVTLSASLGVRALLDMGGAANMPSGISLRCTSMQPGFEPVESAPADLGGMLTLSAPGCAAYALDMPAGSQPLYWEVSAQGFDRKPPSEALAQGLEVSREYLDAEGRPVTTVKQGDVVTVSISARSHGGSVSDAVIVDLLPGGFEMVLNSDIKGQNPSGEPGYKSVDRREDRMIVFSDLAVEPFVFTYKIRAVNKGVYTLPPVQAEAMYNRSLQAHSAGGVMVVE